MRKLFFVLVLFISIYSNPISTQDVEIETKTVQLKDIQNVYEPVTTITIQTMEKECPFTEAEINLIGLVALSEAEGECEEGQRLVIDTILNRIDSSYFPDTVNEVIYQPYQFSSMWNGRSERVTVNDDICELVREEIYLRTNSDVIFFTAGHYSKYGSPMFQLGGHYFSSYE